MPWFLPATWGDEDELRALRKFHKEITEELPKLDEIRADLAEAQEAARDERRRGGDAWSALSADDRLTATRLVALAKKLRRTGGELRDAADELCAEADRLRNRVRVDRKRNDEYSVNLELHKDTAEELRYTDVTK